MSAAEQASVELPAKSTSELTNDLVHQLTTLVHDELELAKSEVTAKAVRAGLGAGIVGGAGVFGLMALACMTACAVAALYFVVPLWLATLIVGLLLGSTAGLLALIGRGQLLRAAPMAPTSTLESVKRDLAWIRTRATSRRK